MTLIISTHQLSGTTCSQYFSHNLSNKLSANISPTDFLARKGHSHLVGAAQRHKARHPQIFHMARLWRQLSGSLQLQFTVPQADSSVLQNSNSAFSLSQCGLLNQNILFRNSFVHLHSECELNVNSLPCNVSQASLHNTLFTKINKITALPLIGIKNQIIKTNKRMHI